MREKLRVIVSNVRGLVCNWDKVTSFNWNEYDIIALNEVWTIQNYEHLKVDGYEVKTMKLRENGRGGGTIIFGKNSIKTTALNRGYH